MNLRNNLFPFGGKQRVTPNVGDVGRMRAVRVRIHRYRERDVRQTSLWTIANSCGDFECLPIVGRRPNDQLLRQGLRQSSFNVFWRPTKKKKEGSKGGSATPKGKGGGESGEAAPSPAKEVKAKKKAKGT